MAEESLNLATGDQKPIAPEWHPETFENDKGFWNIYPALCKGCGLCIEKCPVNVLSWSKRLGFVGTPLVECRVEGCIVCGMCQTVCPEPAIHVERKGKKSPPAAMPKTE